MRPVGIGVPLKSASNAIRKRFDVCVSNGLRERNIGNNTILHSEKTLVRTSGTLHDPVLVEQEKSLSRATSSAIVSFILKIIIIIGGLV